MFPYRQDTTQPFYTPEDDMYATASGYDTWHDQGRIPTSQLMALSSKRLGCIYRVCNGTANDIFRNKFDFVKDTNPDKPIEGDDEIDMLKGWMRRSRFWTKIVDVVDFDHRCGLGHLVVNKYLKEAKGNWNKEAPNTKPENFQSFSPYYMTPVNPMQENELDYDKLQWDFQGGLLNVSIIDHTRVYSLELRREELGLRGLALPELCWIACMCYLNVQYYILKSLSQLGVLTIGVNVEREFPTPTETANYLALLNTMKANNFYVLGRGAEMKVSNASASLSGINDFMEFLKEDMSAAFIYPKNQLFGRADAGGLSGAGAIVSKEDYLASNLSTKQLNLTDDIMYILTEMCHFEHLKNKTIRFNIDLHKTEEQRLQEQMLREQVDQQEVITKQTKLGYRLYSKQVKMQMEMADIQSKMLKQNPEAFMEQSSEDEENKEKQNPNQKGADFVEDMSYRILKSQLNMLKEQYLENKRLMNYLKKDTKDLIKRYDQDDFARRKLRGK